MNAATWSLILGFAGLAAAAQSTDVVALPTETRWGGGDVVKSVLVGNTYTAGNGPGLWITSTGGYRAYLNGELLAWDNQPGRVRFIPLTVLPGDNSISVVALSHGAKPGVLVQLDELDQAHVSGSGWKSSAAPKDNAWKSASYSDASWGAADVSGSATALPDGSALTGWAVGSKARWIWSSAASDTAVILRYSFKIKAEGFGAATTGGSGGAIVVARTAAEIRTALTTPGARTVLVPEGLYDFRTTRTDNNQGLGWCRGLVQGATGSYDMRAATKDPLTGKGVCDANHVLVSEVTRWETSVNITANKSLIGMGRGAKMRGLTLYVRGMTGYDASNAIFRNLAIYDINPHLVEARDGISGLSTSKLWIDHCSFRWISDGNDMNASKELTVSWSKWDGANQFNAGGTDPFVAMIQNSEITYANNHWINTNGRVPKVIADKSDSRAHVYGNLFENNNGYLIGAFAKKLADGTQLKGEVLLESNHIRNASKMRTQKDDLAGILSKNNVWEASAGKYYSLDPVTGARIVTEEPKDSVFTPTYVYALNPVADLPNLIPARSGIGAGWNDLPGYDDPAVVASLGPTVAMTAPANLSAAKAPATFVLQATATAGGKAVSKVDFYVGNTLVGTATATPYKVTVDSIGAGNWSIVAKATDAAGLVSISDPVTVSVAPGTVTPPDNLPPVVSLAGSASNGVAPFNVSLTATASDADGTVRSVSFYKDGVLAGTVTASPWKLSVNALAAGSHVFTAVATDNGGATATSASLKVDVVKPPTTGIALTAAPSFFSAACFLNYTLTSTGNVTFRVHAATGAEVRAFTEQNAKLGANRTWLKDGHMLASGSYTVRMYQNGKLLATVSIRKF